MSLTTFADTLLRGIDTAAFGGLEGEIRGAAVGKDDSYPVVVGHFL